MTNKNPSPLSDSTAQNPHESSRKRSIEEVLLNKRMLICIFTGFSSGLPLYLLFNLVPAWLKTEGLNLKMIGALALVQFPYAWKFLWSPLLDRYTLPWLGRRRGWMALSHLALIGVIALLGSLSPGSPEQLNVIIVLLTGVAFLSASLDIVLDAFRRELLSEEELGLGNSIHVNAYRVASLVPGSLSLILSDHAPWSVVFAVTALFMAPGLLMTLSVSEPALRVVTPKSLRESVVEPFREFFSRNGVKTACFILAFILFYKLGDSLCTALATPFYQEMGYSKTEIGIVAKNAGLWPSLVGALLGGLWMVQLGINRALWLFGVVQVLSIFGFAWLAWSASVQVGAVGSELPAWISLLAASPQSLTALAIVVGLEAVGVGLGSAAFVAFIARTTHPSYTATQLALFTSLMAVPRTFLNATTGYWVEILGWTHFFLFCVVLAIPGMLLLVIVAPWNGTHTALTDNQDK